MARKGRWGRVCVWGVGGGVDGGGVEWSGGESDRIETKLTLSKRRSATGLHTEGECRQHNIHGN